MAETPRVNGRIDLSKPRYEQSTLTGRLKHFLSITDMRAALVGNGRLYEAKELLQQYRLETEPPGTTDEQVWYAKKLYESAFHPDSGELQNVIGRMSFQVPGGMLVTGGMLQFYKTNGAVVFWQWINQSFNALVNYTNRNAASTLTPKQITVAYLSATTSALVTALSLKSILAKRASPVMQRLVPFLAVASANMVNIPMTRQSELVHGVALYDENNNKITESRYAACRGIGLVVGCRIFMAAPGMMVLPFIMEALEKKPGFMRYPRLHMPFQTLMVGVFLTGMVPLACSLFPQRSSLSMDQLKQREPEKYDTVSKYYGGQMPEVLYFNKGL